ncbi:MAG TPA: PepSY domain-containing protein [Rhizomicrobium sp.]|jgi:uncharacterized membrane protein YkoI|nr:PepSY domain-containing protein [Rhizomicrobium sp.]
MRKVILPAATTLVAGLICSGRVLAEASDAYSGPVKISMAQATKIALKAQPGIVTDKELERESGGTGVRYSFDIRAGKVTHEIGVDANTGKVLENSVEGPNPD